MNCPNEMEEYDMLAVKASVYTVKIHPIPIEIIYRRRRTSLAIIPLCLCWSIQVSTTSFGGAYTLLEYQQDHSQGISLLTLLPQATINRFSGHLRRLLNNLPLDG